MLFKSSIVVAMATAAFGAIVPPLGGAPMSCLTPKPNTEQKAIHKQFAVAEASALASASSSITARATTYINTYIHVVSASKSSSDGYLSRDTLNKQMQVLNQDFQGTGFQFSLQNIDWTVNYNWAYNGDQMAMKRALRKGDFRTLNLYYITDIGGGNTGYCYYPTYNPQGDNFYIDGCIMSAWTAPGAGNTAFSTGRITTHEVGHWSNLIHTFDGDNCNGYGDYVDDTPAEASHASGCQRGRDTCPSPGLDPIYNHMDYSDDYCRTEFTAGQISRMQSSYDYYRRNA